LRYRQIDPNDRTDFPIGCPVLTQAFFKREEEWLPVPESWSRNIVAFKTYSTDSEDGQRLWEWAQGAISDPIRGFADDAARFGEPTLIRPRLGQGAFRIIVTDAYERRCAISQL
jgi:putative restriction endonuclease